MTEVVATVPTLTEAEIACSALRAAGFDAQVLDIHLGRTLTISVGRGGFKIAVPEQEAADARAVLAQIASERS